MVLVKQLGAYIIILFIFIGSTNITINQHLCKGELESMALFVEAQPCEHASAQSDLPPCHKKATSKKCCSTNQIKIEAVDWFQFFDVTYEFKSDNRIIAFFNSEEINWNLLIQSNEDFSLKKPQEPPILKEDIFIWNECFLI